MADHRRLEARGLRRSFGAVCAVNDVSFTVESGQIVGLMGPNGAGKSTVVNLLGGTLGLDSGTVRLDDVSIGKWPPHRIARAGIARTFQTCRLFAEMTALENVMAVEPVRAGPALWRSLTLRAPSAGRSGESVSDRAMALLDRCAVQEYRGTLAHALPYAVQRRVEIARALALEPSFILLDEPAAGMNEVETEELRVLLAGLAADGLGLLLIEHHVDLVFDLSTYVIVQNFGEIIAEGLPDVVRKDPRVIAAYLGSRHA